jgi:hypothetical protein
MELLWFTDCANHADARHMMAEVIGRRGTRNADH